MVRIKGGYGRTDGRKDDFHVFMKRYIFMKRCLKVKSAFYPLGQNADMTFRGKINTCTIYEVFRPYAHFVQNKGY